MSRMRYRGREYAGFSLYRNHVRLALTAPIVLSAHVEQNQEGLVGDSCAVIPPVSGGSRQQSAQA